MNYKNISDVELELNLKNKVQEETKATTEVLHLLAEVERRRLYSKSYPSLFEYCVKVLKYSAAAAQRRIDSMRAMKVMPELEKNIMTGELNLSSISQAQSFFRQEAKAGKAYSIIEKKEVLEKLKNKSSKECVRELISISPQSVQQEKRRELTPDKTEIKVVLNNELILKLDKIKALMSHKNPNMTDQELIAVMADALLEKIDPFEKAKRSDLRKQKIAEKTNTDISDNARQLPMAEVNLRYIPATVKTEVYLRDQGKCTHPKCNSRRFLEYDHVKPVAMGGETSAENLRLLCRTHNQRAAIDQFGLNKMQMYFKN